METVMHAVNEAMFKTLRAAVVVTLATCATAAAVLVLLVAKLLSMLGPLESLWPM